jgi:hypothetical protein
MTQTNDGGPAFPSDHGHTPDGTWNQSQGMSLRDWFAGQALAGMFRHKGWINTVDGDETEAAARAYRIADAMIAARGANAD